MKLRKIHRVSFLIKLQACNFIKKETLAQVFSCEFCEISKNTFFTEHLWTTASAGEFLKSLRYRSRSHQTCSIKKVFLKFSQNSLKDTCARELYLKLEILAQVLSCKFCKIFKNTISSERHCTTIAKDIIFLSV